MGKSSERELSELLEAKWMDRLEDLLEYKLKYGDCNVPFQFKENQRLANWVLKQRKFYRKGELPPHRVAQLNAIGFEWTSYRRVTWEQRFEQLTEYQKRHGTTIVAEEHGDPQTIALAQWVKKQRTTQRKKEMGPERIAMLNSIDFIWDVEDSSWETRFHELVQFMRIHGNNVNPKEAGLKGWVYRQRSKYHEGILSQEKKQKLSAIDFNWGYPSRESKSKKAIHDKQLHQKEQVLSSKARASPSSQSLPPSAEPRAQEPQGQRQGQCTSNPLTSLVDACIMVSTTKPPAHHHNHNHHQDDWSVSNDSASQPQIMHNAFTTQDQTTPNIVQLHHHQQHPYHHHHQRQGERTTSPDESEDASSDGDLDCSFSNPIVSMDDPSSIHTSIHRGHLEKEEYDDSTEVVVAISTANSSYSSGFAAPSAPPASSSLRAALPQL